MLVDKFYCSGCCLCFKRSRSRVHSGMQCQQLLESLPFYPKPRLRAHITSETSICCFKGPLRGMRGAIRGQNGTRRTGGKELINHHFQTPSAVCA